MDLRGRVTDFMDRGFKAFRIKKKKGEKESKVI